MKKLLAFLLALAMTAGLFGCGQKVPEEPLPSADATTGPVSDGTEEFDLNETDLSTIGELLSDRELGTPYRITLKGLCTPVVLELDGIDLVSISAFEQTVPVSPEAEGYASIYGNLSPCIYDHDGIIYLNIWQGDIGYTCVLFPDGTYLEQYPDEELSLMTYVDEQGQPVQSQFAVKFNTIEQWDGAILENAASRDDFYYCIDAVEWTEEGSTVTAGEYYTISDQFDLDEIFTRLKGEGYFEEFDTLDELLAHEAAPEQQPHPDDTVRQEDRCIDTLIQAQEYDSRNNLITETFYEDGEEPFFIKTHQYDDKDREISGAWSCRGEEVYRYVHTYSDRGQLTETVWYTGNQEVERYTYTYRANSAYSKTFWQNGEKKYTYDFDAQGNLCGHRVYRNGQTVETQNPEALVKTQLLTDLWLPVLDNYPVSSHYYYDGTIPTEDSGAWEVTTHADGSRVLVQGETDEEDGLYYEVARSYNADGLLQQVSYRLEGTEYSREEYEYNANGACTRVVGYQDGEPEYTTENQYNSDGLLIRSDTNYANQQSYYTYDHDDNGQEVTYTTHSETYRYNDQGLLVETVVYEDSREVERTAWEYDRYGNVLPRLDSYEYHYDPEGILTQIELTLEDRCAGIAQLRSRTVYVTRENARQLQQIMRQELSWF